MKQTSIEWFAHQLGITSGSMLEQAKEMHKQEIIDAYEAGLFDGIFIDKTNRLYNDYYLETFKKD